MLIIVKTEIDNHIKYLFAGNGFYLYSKDQLQLGNDKQCSHKNPNLLLIDKEQKVYISNDTHGEDDDTPVQIIIVSLWYWWYVKYTNRIKDTIF